MTHLIAKTSSNINLTDYTRWDWKVDVKAETWICNDLHQGTHRSWTCLGLRQVQRLHRCCIKQLSLKVKSVNENNALYRIVWSTSNFDSNIRTKAWFLQRMLFGFWNKPSIRFAQWHHKALIVCGFEMIFEVLLFDVSRLAFWFRFFWALLHNKWNAR